MKYLFIMNPGSRDGRSKKTFDKIFELAKKINLNYEYKKTKTLEDAYIFSKKANQENVDIIVAVGGDGTINNVLKGFFDERGKRISNSKMGVIYTGTSPDFCKSYNIPLDLEKAVNLLSSADSKKIKIGKIELSKKREFDKKNAFEIKEINKEIGYFGCCANIGLGATVAKKANSGIRKKLGDFLGTFLSLIQTIISYKANDFTVKTEGKISKISKVANISIGLTYYIASGIKVKNDLTQEDNNFYKLTVQKMNFKRWFQTIKTVYSGKTIENKEFLSLEYLKSIEFAGNDLNPNVEFDGDPKGFLPCKIEMAKDKLDLICEK